VFDNDDPVLVDMIVTPTPCLPFVPPGKGLIDMITSYESNKDIHIKSTDVPS